MVLYLDINVKENKNISYTTNSDVDTISRIKIKRGRGEYLFASAGRSRCERSRIDDSQIEGKCIL